MRTIHPDLAPYWLGGLLEVTSVDGGPTDEQLRIIQGLLRGYFGLDGSTELVPLPASELAPIITDEGSRDRLVQTMMLLEFARHPASVELASAVEAYAAALGVDEPMLVVARDAANRSRELVWADWSRFERRAGVEPQLRDRSADELRASLEALRDCPAGSLGRGFVDFYERWGLDLPTADDPHAVGLVTHDFAHVLSGYEPNAVEEVALSAMLCSATNGVEHFSALTASLALYEVGLLEFPGITPTTGVLDRDGAPEVLGDAMRRGSTCTADFVAIDHLALPARPLDEVRGSLGIQPRAA